MLLPMRRPPAAPCRPAFPPHVSPSLGLRRQQHGRAGVEFELRFRPTDRVRVSTVARASPVEADASPAGLGRRAIVGVVLAMSLSAPAYYRAPPPSSALTEENLIFLEAWRAVDRAYYDKSFNGKSWFRYRERALRDDPMNTREETWLSVMSAAQGGPVEKAGIVSGDVILAIDNRRAEDMDNI